MAERERLNFEKFIFQVFEKHSSATFFVYYNERLKPSSSKRTQKHYKSNISNRYCRSYEIIM